MEKERGLLVGKLSVDGGKGLSLGLNIGLVLAIQKDLQDALSIGLHPSSLANNFGRVADIVKDGVLDLGQSTRTRTGPGSLSITVVRLSQDGTLGNHQDVLSREFLFQLSDQSLVDFLEGS